MRSKNLLYSPEQARAVLTTLAPEIYACVRMGKRLELEIREEKRTLPQNDHIQRLTRSIGKALGRDDHDLLRCLLVEQWRHETKRPAQYEWSWDGLRMVDVSNRSSALEKPVGSEFIDWLQATEAGLEA